MAPAPRFEGNAFKERIIRPRPPKRRTNIIRVLKSDVGRKKMCKLIKIPARIITRPAIVRSHPMTDLPSKKINPMPIIKGTSERPKEFMW